jgi:hypothetical protein
MGPSSHSDLSMDPINYIGQVESADGGLTNVYADDSFGGNFISLSDHFKVIKNLKNVETSSRLIGLTGLARSGKSTTAQILCAKYSFERFSFSGPIKSMIRTLLQEAGLTESDTRVFLDGEMKEEPIRALNWKSPRFAMQSLGTEWGRELLGDNIWVNLRFLKIDQILRAGGSVVLDDARFTNEVDAIRERGGLVVRIVRPENAFEGTPHSKHSSETQALTADRIIVNNGSMADLENNVRELVQSL